MKILIELGAHEFLKANKAGALTPLISLFAAEENAVKHLEEKSTEEKKEKKTTKKKEVKAKVEEKPTKEPEAPKEEAPQVEETSEEINLDTLRKAFHSKQNEAEGNIDKLKEVLGKFGATSVFNIPEDKFSEVLKAVEAI